MKQRCAPTFMSLIILALLAIVGMLIFVPWKPAQSGTAITGAVTASTSNVLTITASDTKGTIQLKQLDGPTVSLPIAEDGSTAVGSAQNEAVYLSKSAQQNPNDLFYLEGETCTGTTSITNCVGAEFLVVKDKTAHIFEITGIDIEKNEIDIEDKTGEQETLDTIYSDGSAASITVGDKTLTLTLTEATKTVVFTALGSSNGALIELSDKAMIELINANKASQSFEGLFFSEFTDGALVPEKYISDLRINIFFDDQNDKAIEIGNSLLTDLGVSQGSGWYKASVDDPQTKMFYSNKGTLWTYDDEKKQKLTIGHMVSTAAAKVAVKKTAAQEEAAGWTMYGVDREGDVGKDSAFVLDKEGYAHISYFDETNDALKYAYQTAKGWYVQRVDSGNVGRSSDIALDSDGNPHIVYSDTKNSQLKYAYSDGKEWYKGTLEAAGQYAILPALTFDSSNTPHIAYYDFIDDDLVHLWYDADIWQKETVDSDGDIGTGASIAMDSTDNPHISYFDNTYDILKYAWYDGTEWHVQKIDTSGSAGLFSAISLNSQDYPLIWYYNQLKEKVQYLQYLGEDQWDQETFSLEGFALYRGDIVLDENGYVHFSYYWEADKDLRYATGVWE